MRIINDTKLDFKDVMIIPHRSHSISRSEINLLRKFKFRTSTRSLECVPIIASNMDTIGTMNMAKALAKYSMLTCLHKYYTLDQLDTYNFNLYNTFYTSGINDNDYEKLLKVVDNWDIYPNICIDVPNGYTDAFVDKVKEIREHFPSSIIMAGNVCTPEIVEELILHGGVDIVKVGIGSGCFVAGTKITTKNGKKSIEKIKTGDQVLTHDGTYKSVTGTTSRVENETLIDINGIKCTKNHQFYVIHKSDSHYISQYNIHEKATWVSAENLSEDWCLVKIYEQYSTLYPVMYEIIPIKKYNITNPFTTKETVYDIEVEDNHSFCVENNIIVHNSACRTRQITGVGYKQLSAIIECADAAHGLQAHICADGGCSTPGDICKGFCGGCDFVMLGGLFSGTDECEGEWKYEKDSNKKKSFKFYGMASEEALKKYNNNKEYRASEGCIIETPYKGSVDLIIQEILGGIRSCCTYIGAASIKEMSKRATFIRV